MTFGVEIMLRGDTRVHTDIVEHERPLAEWATEDVEAVLYAVLRAVDRAQHPDGVEPRPLSLRGLSWIVSPYQGAVVIALEIPSASIVAGPLAVEEAHLDALMRRALDPARAAGSSPTVH
jgi:hypothetical protein